MTRDPRHDVLFEPVKIGPKVTPNRFFQVPHCDNAGTIRPGAQAAFRAMKAEGGWGTVCIEFTAISPETDDSPHVCARIWDEGDVINLRHTAESVQKHGSLARDPAVARRRPCPGPGLALLHPGAQRLRLGGGLPEQLLRVRRRRYR